MDIEKLKSLIRLANNNPNDNEANLAARKACKVLAENEFALLKPATAAHFSGDPFMDIINHMRREATKQPAAETWNDVKRSTESAWSSKSQYPPHQQPYTYVNVPWEPTPPRPEKKIRVCVKCKTPVETRRVTNVFTCDKCEWGAYQNREPKGGIDW